MTSTPDIADHYRTVVIGAGPAGVMAALHAASGGPVLLADSSALPRDKSCGGMLHEQTQEFLSTFGAIPDDMILDPEWVHFRYHDWDRGIRTPTTLRFANVDRRAFDDWLMSLLPSNVTVASAHTCVQFAEEPRAVRVTLRDGDSTEHSISCDVLIGCDGPRSSVRRTLGVGSVANYVTLQDFCRIEGDIEPYFDCIYLRDIGDSFGYAYVVPKGDVAIVGSVFYPRTKHPHEKHEQVLSILRTSLPLGESLKREPWLALSVRHRRDVACGGGRVLLAGEAGGFMSPTSGEGISYALNSGRLAGIAAAEHSAEDALVAYARSARGLVSDIHRRLMWLPFMESSAGKYVAGFMPASLVSRVTQGL